MKTTNLFKLFGEIFLYVFSGLSVAYMYSHTKSACSLFDICQSLISYTLWLGVFMAFGASLCLLKIIAVSWFRKSLLTERSTFFLISAHALLGAVGWIMLLISIALIHWILTASMNK